ALLPRFDSSGRHFWKSLHGAIGIWSAFLIAFLILTGLPWATVWGDMFRKVTAMAGIGYPASVRTHGAPASTSLTVKDVANGAAPWTLETMPAPLSDEHAGHHSGGSAPAVAAGNRVDLDRVAAVVDAHKMTEPYRLVFPRNAAGVFSAYTYPDQPEGQRSLYIDQYSGKVVRDVGFKDYGIAAKAVELGVQLHMGNYFGRLNQIVMLIPCVGIVVLAITGPYMWWQRRPKGMFGAPKVVEPTTLRSFALITLAMAALFPLAGASLVAVGVLDAIGSRFLGPRQPAA
ncbi:MAG: PepSY domain-containing protein, partial [Hyphomicrobium sp.]